MCLTIIGIPFGIQVIKLAQLSLWPFGKDVVDRGRGSGCLALIMNILWLFLGGIWIALHHLIWALILAITIVNITRMPTNAFLLTLSPPLHFSALSPE